MGQLSFKDMTEQQLDEFISRVEDAIKFGLSLDASDLQLLLEAFKACLFVQEKLSRNDLTILKLKKLLGMVQSSERLKKIVEAGDDQSPPKDTGDSSGPSKPKKTGNGKKPKDDFSKKETIILPIESYSKGDSCPECSGGKLYKYQPSEFVRISGSSPMKAEVFVRSRLRCNLCGKVFTADLPDEVAADGEGSQRYGYSARSLMAILKYFTGLPFYRQQTLQTVLGVPVSSSSVFDQCESLSNDIKPVVDFLRSLAASAQHYHIDDTTHKILDAKPIKKNKRGSSKEVLRSGIYSSGMIATHNYHDIVLFKTNIGHSGEFIDEILEGRSKDLPVPILMSDALPSNKPSVGDVIWSLCNVHARRMFYDIKDQFPDECSYVLGIFGKIFDTEDETKAMSPEDRLSYHKKNSLPLFDEMISWSKDGLETKKIEPNGNLGRAVNYLLKNERGLRKFLEVPGAKLDNNYMERILKIVVLGRKNYHFYKTAAGAAIADVIMSLAATAYQANINIFDYFTDIQRNRKLVKADPEAWTPWRYTETIASLNPTKAAS